MKFSQSTTTAKTLFFTYTAAAAVLLSSNNNNNLAEAMVSPYVTCCEEEGGMYEILNNGDKGQSGFCKIDGQNIDELTFFTDNCAQNDEPTLSPTPAPTPGPTPKETYKYAVYAVNDSCGLKSGQSITATFTLLQDDDDNSSSSSSSSTIIITTTVDISEGQCVYVGGTNLDDDLVYTVNNSYVSTGHVSCSAIGNKNDGDCNLLGMAENACVVNIC